MAFANTALGAVHGLAHPVGALFHAPHGLVCALLLPHVCEFNLSAQPEKFDRIAARIGCKSGRDVPAALSALNRRVGIADRLGKFGMEESAFPRIIADSRSGSMANNPARRVRLRAESRRSRFGSEKPMVENDVYPRNPVHRVTAQETEGCRELTSAIARFAAATGA